MPYQRPEDDRDIDRLRRFGAQLRRCRLNMTLSQEQLARLSGVSQSSISRLENAKASSAAMFKVVRLSDAMGAGMPLGFCPHSHQCSWEPLDADGRPTSHRTPPAYQSYFGHLGFTSED